jgi:hypothetical protein
MIRGIIKFHYDLTVKAKVGDTDVLSDPTPGVIITVLCDVSLRIHITTKLHKSEYAGDKTELFATREASQTGMQLKFTVFRRFRLTYHVPC